MHIPTDDANALPSSLGEGGKIRYSKVTAETYIKLMTLLMLQYDTNIIMISKNLSASSTLSGIYTKQK